MPRKPRGIAIDRDGSRLYLSDQTANALVVVDTAKSQVLATIALGDSPEAIYLSPDGKWLSAAIEENDQILIVDLTALKVDRRIKMKGKNPEHAVWSPDGKWLYVSAEEADSVDIVDLAKNAVVKSVKVGDRPRGIGFLPDSSRAYVAAENADTVNVFDTSTHEVIAKIKAGSRSNGVLVHPDGKRVFVTSGGKGTVQVIDSATNTIVTEIPVGKASMEHGAHPGWQETLCRMRTFERRRGCRHRYLQEDWRNSGGRTPVGCRNPLTGTPGAKSQRRSSTCLRGDQSEVRCPVLTQVTVSWSTYGQCSLMGGVRIHVPRG